MPLQQRTRGVPPQLIEAASLYTLRAALGGDGATYQAAIDGTLPADGPEQAQVTASVDEAARVMAFAITAGISIVDVEAAVIDGVMHCALIDRLVEGVRAELRRYNHDGLILPEVRPGTVGRDARQRGGAMLPVHARFAPSNSLFLKDESGAGAEYALIIH